MLREKLSEIISTNHIVGIEKYFKAAVVIPLVILNEEEYILFEKRAADIRQGGEVSLPGGEVEPQENDSSISAIRETCEELGIENNKVKYIGKYGLMITPFGALIDVHLVELLIDKIEQLNYDKTEVQSIFIIPLKYFLENQPEIFYAQAQVVPSYFDKNGNNVELFPAKRYNLPEKYSKPWGTHKHRILVYQTKPEVVWGITAEIIYDFTNKLKALN